MIIDRDLAEKIRNTSRKFPCVTITGPRQSGKTTLCRTLFPERPYMNLESLDVRIFATEDPRAFLAQFPDGAMIDEVQCAPDILSCLQGIIAWEASIISKRNCFESAWNSLGLNRLIQN